MEAQFLLGSMLYQGSCLDRDLRQAVHFLGQAGKQGLVQAHFLAGLICLNDLGDYAAALQWNREAANRT